MLDAPRTGKCFRCECFFGVTSIVRCSHTSSGCRTPSGRAINGFVEYRSSRLSANTSIDAKITYLTFARTPKRGGDRTNAGGWRAPSDRSIACAMGTADIIYNIYCIYRLIKRRRRPKRAVSCRGGAYNVRFFLCLLLCLPFSTQDAVKMRTQLSEEDERRALRVGVVVDATTSDAAAAAKCLAHFAECLAAVVSERLEEAGCRPIASESGGK